MKTILQFQIYQTKQYILDESLIQHLGVTIQLISVLRIFFSKSKNWFYYFERVIRDNRCASHRLLQYA